MASVIFTLECRATKPGEAVFITGSHPVIGEWSPEKAVPMRTTTENFPKWSSPPLPFPPSQAVEFKFLLRSEKGPGPARWEDFPGNRHVTPAQCPMILAAEWGRPELKTTHLSEMMPKDSHDAPEMARQAHEEVLRQQAEDGYLNAAEEVKQSCPLANIISEREVMRRNFSQSLMCLDEEVRPSSNPASRATSKEPAQASLDTVVVQAPIDDDEDDRGLEDLQPLRGVPLKHIMSLSALTTMLDAEEKTEARKKKKSTTAYKPFNSDVPVVIVTSEIAPYSKTGGLGLVAASYSYEFPRAGHRTMVVAPKYKHYDGINYCGETRVMVNGREEMVKYWHKFTDCSDGKGCDFVFVEHPCIQREGGLYNGDDGREYPDNLLRFTLLSLAAMEAPLILNINGSRYGDKVIFLANDWQAGLVPLYLCYKYRKNNCYTQARVIYVIHNMGYQGQYHSINACQFFGIDGQAASDVLFGSCVNLSKGALVCADRVLTVSPNYAQEIQTPAGGFNLQDFVRAKAHGMRLAGILNGIDDVWDPETDTNIARNFSLADFVDGKRCNKVELQRFLGLQEDPDIVLIGFVGRLTWQKGVDILGSCINWMMQDTGNGVNGRCQLIMMGNGDRQYSDTLRWAESTFKGRVCGYVGFDPKVEHQMMAGLDLFLMPSRYEPCGLPQMYSQQYGTLPIVTKTGGLLDSVIDIGQGIDKATGFHMEHLAEDKMKQTIYKAMEIYIKRPDDFRTLQRNAMQTDFSWPRAMDEYEKNIDFTLYDPAITR